MVSNELQGLLDEIRKGGTHDSVGTFSLDRFSAARKLSRTQFPRPDYYCLKLVQWAVASRATWVRVTVWPNSLELTHNGEPLGDQLPELVRWALASPTGPDRRLVHLASAILAVQALNPKRVQVWSGQSCLRVAGDHDRVEVSVSSRVLDRIKITGLPLNFGGGWSLFTNPMVALMSLGRPEVQLLMDRCAFSEIPVYLNGVPLSRAFLGIRQHTPRVVNGRTRLYIPAGHSLPVRVALAPAGDAAGISVPGPETAGVFPQGRFHMRILPEYFKALGRHTAPPEAVRMPHLTLGDFPMYRGWAILLDYQGNLEHRITAGFRSNHLKLVQDGVLIETIQPLVGDRKLMAEGIVATGTMPLDLSHFRYVRGPEITNLIQEVRYFLELGRQ